MKNFNWLNQNVVEQLLNCKRGKLWKLRSEGQIEYSKIGGQVYYYLPSIEKLLLENSTLTQESINSHLNQLTCIR